MKDSLYTTNGKIWFLDFLGSIRWSYNHGCDKKKDFRMMYYIEISKCSSTTLMQIENVILPKLRRVFCLFSFPFSFPVASWAHSRYSTSAGELMG